MPDRLFSDAYLAGIYDVWHPRETRDDFDFYLPHIMAAEAVLDVGCGTGALLHEARDRGHPGRLCGLDPAPGMLERAQRRSDIDWVLGDLASIAFEGAFDLIVMTGHAFQTLVTDAELRASFAKVARALSKGGCFAFETRSPLARGWASWKPENAVGITDPDGYPVRISTEIVSPYDRRVLTFTHTFTGSNPNLPMVSESTLRFVVPEDIAALMAEAGLTIQEQFGDFDGAPLETSSPEIITIAAPRRGRTSRGMDAGLGAPLW